MIKKFAINCISDEIHHPVITKNYRHFLTVVVLMTVLSVLLENQNNIYQNYKFSLYIVQTFLFSTLFIDFLFRLIGAYNHSNTENYDKLFHYDTLKEYLFSYYGIIDFMAIIPFFIHLFAPTLQDIKLIFSVATLLKLTRFSPALIILKDVIVNERKSLFASLYLMMVLTFSISTILYFIERGSNPGFATLLDSIWWAIITLATVGYGDVVPHSELGKLLSGIAAISGFGMFALPAGILASGFAEEMKRLRNSANWKMVAKVPLFCELEFGVIADITKMLHVKRFVKNEIIIKEGESADAMYFLLSGSVTVDKKNIHVILKEGEFFGEIALLKKIPRTATVTANTRCELLELTTYDFQNFIKKNPGILSEIEKVASLRYKS